MKKAPPIVPASNPRQNAAASLPDLETCKRTQYEMELLKVLAKGEKEIAEGKVHELSEVIEAADEILDKGKE